MPAHLVEHVREIGRQFAIMHTKFDYRLQFDNDADLNAGKAAVEFEMQAFTDMQLIGVENGKRFKLPNGNEVLPFATCHRVPSSGYIIYGKVYDKQTGETDYRPEIAYTGDTTFDVFLNVSRFVQFCSKQHLSLLSSRVLCSRLRKTCCVCVCSFASALMSARRTSCCPRRPSTSTSIWKVSFNTPNCLTVWNRLCLCTSATVIRRSRFRSKWKSGVRLNCATKYFVLRWRRKQACDCVDKFDSALITTNFSLNSKMRSPQ